MMELLALQVVTQSPLIFGDICYLTIHVSIVLRNNIIFILIQISGIDMAILSLANHSILSYGTFGMWGALLSNNGETIIPKIALKSAVGSEINEALNRHNITSWKFL